MATIFSGNFDDSTKVAFGNTQTTVVNAMQETLPTLTNVDSNNWDDVAIVADGAGDYLRTRSNTGDNSRKAWAVEFADETTAFLTYSVMFESTGGSSHTSDDGFDWGDGNAGTPKTWSTGGKLPGLVFGSPGDNTGGVLANGAWSGRLMWRGQRKSNGIGGSARESVTLSLYFYGEEANGETGLGAANTYFFVQDFAESPTRFGSSGSDGTGDGQYGDSRGMELKTDVWYHLCLGYHAPNNNTGYFKAWTWEDGVDTAWQEQLHVPDIKWHETGTGGIDRLLFQNFWGGATTDWYPDNLAYMRYKNFAAFTTESEAKDNFGLTTTTFEITAPAAAATQLDTPISVSGTAADDGATDYQLYAYNETQASSITDYGVDATFTPGTESFAGDSTIAIGQAGDEITLRARRLT